MTRINKFNYDNWGGEVSTLQDESIAQEIHLYLYKRVPEGGFSIDMTVLDAELFADDLRKAIRKARKERK